MRMNKRETIYSCIYVYVDIHSPCIDLILILKQYPFDIVLTTGRRIDYYDIHHYSREW